MIFIWFRQHSSICSRHRRTFAVFKWHRTLSSARNREDANCSVRWHAKCFLWYFNAILLSAHKILCIILSCNCVLYMRIASKYATGTSIEFSGRFCESMKLSRTVVSKWSRVDFDKHKKMKKKSRIEAFSQVTFDMSCVELTETCKSRGKAK